MENFWNRAYTTLTSSLGWLPRSRRAEEGERLNRVGRSRSLAAGQRCPRPPGPIFPLDSEPSKKVLSVSARELRGALDEVGQPGVGLGLPGFADLVAPDGKVGILGVVGGARAATQDRDCAKDLDASRGCSWVLGRLGQRDIGPRKVSKSVMVWRGLLALPPRSCDNKLDATLLESLRVRHSRQGGIGERFALRAACSLAPSSINAKDCT